ncbi:5,6-dimethylbenzimidazole synthase [Roseobacter sp. OBYS 0001]|uniref:5,6-dimethylbenzimidazole synthase n=1 Tax=Roseobacter sp. OBYS 0001 TaxID=882651 RepID=UPI001BBB9266|nr:5,6-dimethylbenzimidazole synthase [Roseobacter sp. OBYS 0001]GIT87845.1 5,6-dimethylbenzimidazole synthase [Roseobacter sp. OBYS 0001]
MKLTQTHRQALQDILTWRRDVRHFRNDPVAPEVLGRLRASMDSAPSVGNSRPWRILQIEDIALRARIIANFEASNAEAAQLYSGSDQQAYLALKLAGLRDAPVHLAVFTDTAPEEGKGLGRQSMPEMLSYSTAMAIHTLWLAARAENIGVGWVSILDPDDVCATLGVPPEWSLTGYLCLGYAETESDTPLLHQTGWQEDTATQWIIR